jgi:hypothetical protein
MECANCGRHYRTYLSRAGLWCPKEKVLFCTFCQGDQHTCPSCGAKLSLLSGMLVLQGMLFLVIFLFVGAVTTASIVAELQLNSMPVTAVDHLGTGSSAKVFGTVSPGQGTVITVFSYSGGSDNGRHVENFWFNDSTGRAWVEMGSNYSTSPTIASGGEPYPSSGAATGFQYESGNPISIIGTVMVQGNETILQASAVAASPSGFSQHNTTDQLLIFGIPSIVSALVLGVGLALGRSRVRASTLNLPHWALRRPKTLLLPPPSDDIRWLENPKLARFRRMAWGATGATVVLVILFLIIVVSPIQFPQSVFLAGLVLTPILLIVTVVTALSDFYTLRHALHRLGTSPAGIYLDYRHPRQNDRTYLAWTDVRELEAPLPMNRQAFALDTPLGKEFIQNVSPEMMAQVRTQFEAARVSFRDSAAPLRPSVASLLGTGPPASIAETTWTTNALVARWIRYGILLLACEIPAAAAFVLTWRLIGLNQGTYLFFLPAIVGAQTIYFGLSAPREVGISTIGFSIRERSGERSVLWADVAELTPWARGFRYKTFTGFAEALGRIDSAAVSAIVAGLSRARGFDPLEPPPPPPPESAWVENPVHHSAARLLSLFIGLPLALVVASVVSLVRYPLNAYGIFGVALPWIAMVFALYPLILRRQSPLRVAFSSGALFVDWGERETGPNVLRVLRATSIGKLLADVSASAPPRRFLGITSYPLTVRTTAGINLSVGAISPEIARMIASRLRPDQLADDTLRGIPSPGPN